MLLDYLGGEEVLLMVEGDRGPGGGWGFKYGGGRRGVHAACSIQWIYSPVVGWNCEDADIEWVVQQSVLEQVKTQ